MEIELEQIITWILSILPSLIAVASAVGLVIKTISNFKKLKDDVSNMTAMEEVRGELKEVLQENRELKRQLNKTMAKIDHIHRPGE